MFVYMETIYKYMKTIYVKEHIYMTVYVCVISFVLSLSLDCKFLENGNLIPFVMPWPSASYILGK